MKKILPISSSQEDYLEAIAEILEHQEHAHTKDIATKLNVTMPSVTNALQTLSARGLIIYRSHTPVRLTAAGAEKAAIIRRRHHTLKHFFSQLGAFFCPTGEFMYYSVCWLLFVIGPFCKKYLMLL